MELYKTGTGQILKVHRKRDCKGGACVVHAPSAHHMSHFKTHWRSDRGLMERICTHGIGHPDPDHIAQLPNHKQHVESVHGCDGCCVEPIDWKGN